jgi:hypothetical protein
MFCFPASALSRNDPGLLTKSDPPGAVPAAELWCNPAWRTVQRFFFAKYIAYPPSAGMILMNIPRFITKQLLPFEWINLTERKWSTFAQRRG